MKCYYRVDGSEWTAGRIDSMTPTIVVVTSASDGMLSLRVAVAEIEFRESDILLMGFAIGDDGRYDRKGIEVRWRKPAKGGVSYDAGRTEGGAERRGCGPVAGG